MRQCRAAAIGHGGAVETPGRRQRCVTVTAAGSCTEVQPRMHSPLPATNRFSAKEFFETQISTDRARLPVRFLPREIRATGRAPENRAQRAMGFPEEAQKHRP